MNLTPRRGSIAARLTWMNVLVSGIALMVAAVSFLVYGLLSFRAAAVDTLSGEARIVGANSVSAILFNDEASAQTTLSALSSSSDVMTAAIYTPDGVLFAHYERDGATPLQPRELGRGVQEADWTDGVDILTGSRIVFQGKEAGTVYIQARLHGLQKQAIQYAAIAGIILLFCLGVALLVGAVFRKLLAEPIVSLAQTARMVSRYRDYALRFTPSQSYDELHSLTEAFNEMLSEIQQRDAALETAKVELEERVEERTAQLQAANRELEAFSYTVAHDLRSPLQTINNVCYVLLKAKPDQEAESREPLLMRLRSSVASMGIMIDDLLDLSRSTSATLHLKQLDLSAMAESILENLAEMNPERRVETVVHKKCQVNGDSGLMQIVMQNLLRNAWKFTGRRDQPQIEFGCVKRGKTWVYFVRDNGAGFDPSYADRLFKPFQRLHAASDFPGTGIGLATVSRIIRRHGGEVWAEGEIDKGATFYFTLDSPRP